MSHTPKPWLICDDEVNVYAPETDTAITNAEHINAPDFDEARANAQLIAAAPALLEACEEALKELEFHNWGNTYTGALLRSVIAKAKPDA